MSAPKGEGEEEEAEPAAAGWDDDTDQRGQEGQPHVEHIGKCQQPLRGQDRPGRAALKSKRNTGVFSSN